MARLLLSLSALATCGFAMGFAPKPESTSNRPIEVVGRERPLSLGSTVVTASALPDAP